jgi:hypothetical protein
LFEGLRCDQQAAETGNIRSWRRSGPDDINAVIQSWRADMPDLLVRGVDEELIRALKECAGAHGRSAEADTAMPGNRERIHEK